MSFDLDKITADGLDDLFIIADFDRTLTYGVVNGKKSTSIISVLRDKNYLSPEYPVQAQALFDYYHPQEIDPCLDREQKVLIMDEWWQKHNELLFKSELKREDLKGVIAENVFFFRGGVLEFLDFLKEKNIPLIIMSASGCGEVIPMFFEKHERDYDNIHFVVNSFAWKDDQAVATKGKIIHSFNKNGAMIIDNPDIYQQVKNRKNIIILGDGIGDIAMGEGLPYDNILKIGFLNYQGETLKQYFLKNYDMVITGDGDFSPVNKLLFN